MKKRIEKIINLDYECNVFETQSEALKFFKENFNKEESEIHCRLINCTKSNIPSFCFEFDSGINYAYVPFIADSIDTDDGCFPY